MRFSFQFFFRWLFTLCVLYGIYLLAALSVPYLAFKPGVDFLVTKQFIYHVDLWRWGFYAHVLSSTFIILTGLFQFNRWLIHHRPAWHRRLGKIYLVLLVFVSGPGALVMGFYANGGYPAQTSFVLLAVLWEFSAIYAYLLIRKRKFQQHGDWLLRNYALTLSAVTLRFYNYLFGLFGFHPDPRDAYIILTWISWVPNLFIAELLIRSGFIRKRLTTL